MFIFFRLWPKNDFAQVITKKPYFCCNVDIFRLGPKNNLHKWSQKSLIFALMLIFFELLPKNDFSQVTTKTFFLLECWYFSSYCQKIIFHKWSQINLLFAVMLIFSELWTKNDFSQVITKQPYFCCNIDIFRVVVLICEVLLYYYYYFHTWLEFQLKTFHWQIINYFENLIYYALYFEWLKKILIAYSIDKYFFWTWQW